jgi:large exoprotein involved in heme utilization and adhesion
LLVVAGWLGAAVLAVVVGLTAINVIGAGLTSSQARPRTPAEVARDLAAAPTTAASLGSRPSPSVSAAQPTGLNAHGGTVVARCVGSLAEILTMSPDPGFEAHEWDRGPQREAEGEFRSTSDNHDRGKFTVTCRSGQPSLSSRSSD